MSPVIGQLDPDTRVKFSIIKKLPQQPTRLVLIHDIEGDERRAFLCEEPRDNGSIKSTFYDIETGERINVFKSG